MKLKKYFLKIIVYYLSVLLVITPLTGRCQSDLSLPAVSVANMVTSDILFTPPMLIGMIVDIKKPFSFDFILDTGNVSLKTETEIRNVSQDLIKYFLTSLTMPENELWVNLSPYEKDRIVPEKFGQTMMGIDLIAQDYILKQLTASLLSPRTESGAKFWEKVNAQLKGNTGNTAIPADLLSKVWIIPEHAKIYENGSSVYVLEARLKVRTDQDFLPVFKEEIIPVIEKMVNESKDFAKLRQIYHSLILATWYKKKLKNTFLSQSYADKKNILGMEISEKNMKEKIYQEYLNSFNQGIYDFIKEEYDPEIQRIIDKKYVSGGVILPVTLDPTNSGSTLPDRAMIGSLVRVRGGFLSDDETPAVNVVTEKAANTQIFDDLRAPRLINETGAPDLAMMGTYFKRSFLFLGALILTMHLMFDYPNIKNYGGRFINFLQLSNNESTELSPIPRKQSRVSEIYLLADNALDIAIQNGIISIGKTFKIDFTDGKSISLGTIVELSKDEANNDWILTIKYDNTDETADVKGSRILSMTLINAAGEGEEGEEREEKEEDVGGIDFNPNYLDITEQEKGISAFEQIDPQLLKNIQTNGLSPVIYNVTAIKTFPLFNSK